MAEGGVRFRFDRAERSLTAAEARVLVDWLARTSTQPAGKLAIRLRSHFRAGSDTPMDLGADEVIALRDVLADADVNDHVGLKLLQQMLVLG